jgi:hypothetical protein
LFFNFRKINIQMINNIFFELFAFFIVIADVALHTKLPKPLILPKIILH